MATHTRFVPAHDSELARAVAEFCSRDRGQHHREEFGSDPKWRAVRAAGSELWLDSADLDANRGAWTREFGGLTTNNTLLNKVAKEGSFDELVPEAADMLRRADPSLSDDDLVLELGFIVNAVQARSLARAFDGVVSVELHTGVVHDADASYEYGRRFHAVCPEHFVIKIALTPEGLLAARRLERDGVPVNCTVGFSPRQNYLVARFARPHYVNVFLGRINSFFEQSGYDASDSLGTPVREGLPPGEAATLASQQAVRNLIAGGMADARTRQIAASMRDGSQVASLAGVDVLTMPVSAAEEFRALDAGAGTIDDRSRQPVLETRREGETDTSEAHTGVFFRVDDRCVGAAEQLLLRHPDTLDAGRIRAVLADNYLGDLFPDLSPEDRERIAADGKIPDAASWEARVGDRAASWDGLLTEAAIASFAADQAQLDDRLRQLLE